MDIRTLRQYASAQRSRIHEEYGVPLAEVKRIYTDDCYLVDYLADVTESIECGIIPSLRVWHTLPQTFRAEIFRNAEVRRHDDTIGRALVDLDLRG